MELDAIDICAILVWLSGESQTQRPVNLKIIGLKRTFGLRGGLDYRDIWTAHIWTIGPDTWTAPSRQLVGGIPKRSKPI